MQLLSLFMVSSTGSGGIEVNDPIYGNGGFRGLQICLPSVRGTAVWEEGVRNTTTLQCQRKCDFLPKTEPNRTNQYSPLHLNHPQNIDKPPLGFSVYCHCLNIDDHKILFSTIYHMLESRFQILHNKVNRV